MKDKKIKISFLLITYKQQWLVSILVRKSIFISERWTRNLCVDWSWLNPRQPIIGLFFSHFLFVQVWSGQYENGKKYIEYFFVCML